MGRSLGKVRILLVEDSPAIALAVSELLDELGYFVVGPTGCMATALELAEREHLSAAIVDLNIRGTKAYSVLRILDRRGIPYIVASGYADWAMPCEFAGRPRLTKPFSERMLEEMVVSLVGRPKRANKR